jgi:hypothetical protein
MEKEIVENFLSFPVAFANESESFLFIILFLLRQFVLMKWIAVKWGKLNFTDELGMSRKKY